MMVIAAGATVGRQEPEAYIIADDPLIRDIVKRFELTFLSCPSKANGNQQCKTLRKGNSVFIEVVSTFKVVIG